MAKTNKKKIIQLCNDIVKSEGQGSVFTIGSSDEIMNVPRWSTGIEDLDKIIGGGMPEGRVIEIYGAESSGKTTLGYHLASMHELVLDIPIEGTFDGSRAKVFGNVPHQFLVYRAKYGEDAFNKMIKFAQTGIPLIILDSVPSMQPRDDIEKIMKAVGKNGEEELRIGGIARLMTKYLPALEEVCETTGTTVIFINQIRDKMNAMMFGEKTDTPGGHKFKHSASLRIQVARRSYIEITNKNPHNSAKTEIIGMILKCKVTKSKVSAPRGECEIPLIYERGFISYDELPEVKKEISKARAEQYGKRYKEE